jgi:hypothetical protein
VDRRRIELVEPGVPRMPVHHDSHRLDVEATGALVAEVRASSARAAAAALDDLPGSITSICLRDWPDDFPAAIAVQRRAPWDARADAIMFVQDNGSPGSRRDYIGWEILSALPTSCPAATDADSALPA